MGSSSLSSQNFNKLLLAFCGELDRNAAVTVFSSTVCSYLIYLFFSFEKLTVCVQLLILKLRLIEFANMQVCLCSKYLLPTLG